MIIKLETKMTVTDNEGNVIKEKVYGRAYLTPIDLLQAAADGWYVRFYNTKNKKKKKYSKDTKELYKIVDTLINQTKRTILSRFLCRSGEVWEKHKEEIMEKATKKDKDWEKFKEEVMEEKNEL